MVLLDTDHVSSLDRAEAGGATLKAKLALFVPSEIATSRFRKVPGLRAEDWSV